MSVHRLVWGHQAPTHHSQLEQTSEVNFAKNLPVHGHLFGGRDEKKVLK